MGGGFDNTNQMIYFSKARQDNEETMAAWTGGRYYKHLFSIHIFGLKIEFWRKF